MCVSLVSLLVLSLTLCLSLCMLHIAFMYVLIRLFRTIILVLGLRNPMLSVFSLILLVLLTIILVLGLRNINTFFSGEHLPLPPPVDRHAVNKQHTT